MTIVDGYGRAPNTLFPAFDQTRAHAAAAQSGEEYDGQTVHVPIQGFVIRDGSDITIVDAGAPDGYSPTTGAYMDNLAKAGIDPEKVTRLAMTHLHVDHVGQMVRPDGSKTFPNAELVYGAGDWDHFFSQSVYDKTKPGGQARASLDVSRRALAPYADRRREIDGEVEFAPGLTILPLNGHTPGHSGIRIDDAGDSLLIWGDTIHANAFQLAEPDWGVLFDVDTQAAIATRRRLFEELAQSGMRVLGPHVPTPGPWRVERAPIGYRLIPA
jgi:glyoxylase-like metal-dependent hydrolase (beta-lactamase superfamily II)